MGLGKTLQSITLLYTVLRQGIAGSPTARRVLVVCPTSLVNNWAKEIQKWVGDRVRVLPMAEVSRDKAIMDINTFITTRSYGVLIISYETFRIHAARFHAVPESCDLLICDEAHRLKNDATLTTKVRTRPGRGREGGCAGGGAEGLHHLPLSVMSDCSATTATLALNIPSPSSLLLCPLTPHPPPLPCRLWLACTAGAGSSSAGRPCRTTWTSSGAW